MGSPKKLVKYLSVLTELICLFSHTKAPATNPNSYTGKPGGTYEFSSHSVLKG
jgi:hypothetical protein